MIKKNQSRKFIPSVGVDRGYGTRAPSESVRLLTPGLRIDETEKRKWKEWIAKTSTTSGLGLENMIDGKRVTLPEVITKEHVMNVIAGRNLGNKEDLEYNEQEVSMERL